MIFKSARAKRNSNVTYRKDSISFIGSIDEGGIVAFDNDPSLPKHMLGFLDEGLSSMEKANSLHADKKNRISLSDVNLKAPISRPPKIIAIGLNYSDHLEEVKAAGREIDKPVVLILKSMILLFQKC